MENVVARSAMYIKGISLKNENELFCIIDFFQDNFFSSISELH